MAEDRFLTVAQAASLLQLDPDTLRLLAREKKVPAAKVGRQWRFDLGLLREWMREQSFAERAAGSRRLSTRKTAGKKRSQ